MVDQDFLKLYALKTGLGLKYLSKDEKVSLALEQLRPLFPEAIFKGGTALNRIYIAKIGKSRFSEDIDLDFVAGGSFEDKKRTIIGRMKNLRGFDVGEPRRMNWTLRFDCGYTNEFGEQDQIKIEFYLKGQEAMRSEDMLVVSPFIESHPTVFRTYSMEALMAKKLVALFNRTEGKDIYDMYYVLDLPFDRERFKSSLQSSQNDNELDPAIFFPVLMDKLGEAKKKSFSVGNSANHFIVKDLRPNWKIFIGALALKLRQKLIDEI